MEGFLTQETPLGEINKCSLCRTFFYFCRELAYFINLNYHIFIWLKNDYTCCLCLPSPASSWPMYSTLPFRSIQFMASTSLTNLFSSPQKPEQISEKVSYLLQNYMASEFAEVEIKEVAIWKECWKGFEHSSGNGKHFEIKGSVSLNFNADTCWIWISGILIPASVDMFLACYEASLNVVYSYHLFSILPSETPILHKAFSLFCICLYSFS